MSKFFTKLTIATLGVALTVGTSTVALSCPRGGGGGYYGGFSAPRYNYNYSYRPVQPRPVQIAPRPQVQFSPQQPIQQQQPLQALGGQPAVAGGQQVQQVGGQQVQSTQQFQQAGGQQAAGQPAGGQSAQQVQFTSQQQQGSVASTQRTARQPVSNAAAPAQLSAQQSALQALSAFGVEDAEASNSVTPDPQSEVAFHVGNWTAVLGSNVTVQLTLQADGGFRWTANANGKSSSFEGTYNLKGGSLQLSRSSDNQTLSGSFTRTNSGGFNFKLQGKDDAGLNFARN